MWDVWIHILEIAAECACWGAGGPDVPPLQERGREPAPSSAPVCALGHLSLSPLSLRDNIPTPFGLRPFPPDRGNRPLDKGSRPPGGRLRKNKKGQVLTCPLKHRGETQFRIKFLCLLSFSKKVGYTGPWRKRSIISWVREMADPPWGRFSRSNQVPSPSSSSWRVTVSSSVSRSQ